MYVVGDGRAFFVSLYMELQASVIAVNYCIVDIVLEAALN